MNVHIRLCIIQASGGSDVAEEYDTDHDSSSSEDDDEEGEDGKKRKKIKTKTIAEPGKVIHKFQLVHPSWPLFI